MANPLDLPGPQFLAFYTLTAAILIALLWVVNYTVERGRVPRIDTSDPFLIADLRGGPEEAMRVAAVSLIDRGLLIANEEERTLKANPKASPMRPLERALHEAFETERPATDIFHDVQLRAACTPYEYDLTRLGLLAGEETTRGRHRRLLVVIVILVGLAGAKVVYALTQGRTNVILLGVLALVACIVAAGISNARRTSRGNALLADLRRLFQRLRDRASSIRPGGASAEAALLAAVFGLGALPDTGFGFVRRLYPRAAESSGGSSCGSGCGSSCGGGCGGGCGGCGGGD